MIPLTPGKLADVVEGFRDFPVRTLCALAVQAAPAAVFTVNLGNEVVALLGPAQPARRIGLGTGRIDEDHMAFSGPLALSLVTQDRDVGVGGAPDETDVAANLGKGDLVGVEVHRHAGNALGGADLVVAATDEERFLAVGEILDAVTVAEGDRAGIQLGIDLEHAVGRLAEGLAVGLGTASGQEELSGSARRLLIDDVAGLLDEVRELVVLVGPNGDANPAQIQGVVHLPQVVPVGLLGLDDVVEFFGAVRGPGIAARIGAPLLDSAIDLQEEGVTLFHPRAPAGRAVTAGTVEDRLALAHEGAVALVFQDGERDVRGLPLGTDLRADGFDRNLQGIEVHGDTGQSCRGSRLDLVVAVTLDELARSAGVIGHATALLGGEMQASGGQTGHDGIETLADDAELLSCLAGRSTSDVETLGHVVDTLATGDAEGLASVVHLGHTALGAAHGPDEGTGLIGLDAGLAGDGV